MWSFIKDFKKFLASHAWLVGNVGAGAYDKDISLSNDPVVQGILTRGGYV